MVYCIFGFIWVIFVHCGLLDSNIVLAKYISGLWEHSNTKIFPDLSDCIGDYDALKGQMYKNNMWKMIVIQVDNKNKNKNKNKYVQRERGL